MPTRLFSLLSDWYWEQDAGLRFTRFEGAMATKSGNQPDEAIGLRRWELPTIVPVSGTWEEHRATLVARQPFRDFEYSRVHSDGTLHYVSVSGEPMFDARGRFTGYRGVSSDITKRKRAEEALRLAELNYRSIFDNAVEGMYRVDAAGRVVMANQALARMLGYESPEAMLSGIGNVAHEVYVEPGDRNRYRALLRENGVITAFETRWRRADGAVIWVSMSGRMVSDPAGGRYHLGSAIDITERKREERLLALEHSVARLLAEARTADGALAAVLEAVCRTESWGCGRYFHLDRGADRMRLRCAWHDGSEGMRAFAERSADAAFRRDEGLVGRVWRSGEPLWVPDVLGDARVAHRTLARTAGIHAALVVPVAFDGCVVGMLSVSSGSIRQPDARLLRTLELIGVQLGQFLERKQAEERRAAHLRHQELIARFAESALGRRAADALIEDAVLTVHQALGATAAYLRCEGTDIEVAVLAGTGSGAVPAFAACPALESALFRGELHAFEPATLLPEALGRGRSAGLLKPVTAEDRVHGALCVLAGPGAPLAQEESRFLEAAASVLTAGLRRIDTESRLAFLAQFDTLTGLPNRELLRDRFAQMIVQAQRHDSLLGVLFIDLDHFKHVNDTLGHAGGDELLREIARRLETCVRPGDTVARISGDEFAVLLGDLAKAEDAALVAQKILDRLAPAIDIGGKEIFVSASIGIAAFPADGADAETLLGAADAAMYRAKQSGRGAYQFFTPEIDQRTRERARLGSELRRALERSEFELAYQPKFDLRTGLPCAGEALLRWRRPDGAVVSPAQFVPVLEESGLIVAVGEWVVARVCADLNAWRSAGVAPVPIAVNLSARQFRQPDLDTRIRALLDRAGVTPDLIELEITESQVMHDPEHAERMLRALAEAGIRVAIDDFGTGYSSLSYLTRFPVSALKIDRSFVADVLDDPADAAIVRAIIDMSHTLGFTVIAEGVENEGQASFLRSLGCEQAQGYLFARPMPAADFSALISSGTLTSAGNARPASRYQ